MPDVTYYFNAYLTPVWTNPDNLIDGDIGTFANSAAEKTPQTLTGNNCPGTDLGTITKVELRAFAKGDGNDRLDITPVFTGGNGDTHQTVPVVDPGGWGTYQNITEDMNSPATPFLQQTVGDTQAVFFGVNWAAMTFTTGASAKPLGRIDLYGKKNGSPGDLTISIRDTDGEGKPTGDDLISFTIAEADIPTSADWFGVNVPNYELEASKKYAIVCRVPSGSSGNDVSLYYDALNPYPDGQRAFSSDSGDTWTLRANHDLRFKLSAPWLWSDIQDLDCIIDNVAVSKANVMYASKVEIRVTYTEAPVARASRSHGYIIG